LQLLFVREPLLVVNAAVVIVVVRIARGGGVCPQEGEGGAIKQVGFGHFDFLYRAMCCNRVGMNAGRLKTRFQAV